MNIADQHLASQTKESLIRVLANCDRLHREAKGTVENITGEMVADILLDAAISTGKSPVDAVLMVATANPWDLAVCVQQYLLDMTEEYGVDAGNGFRDLDMSKVPN